MDPIKLIDAKDSDIVAFKFLTANVDEETNSVRCLKSFLSSVSPVFAAMFNEDWDKNNQVMNDTVPFDQFNHFSNFIKCIIGFESIDTLTVYSVTSCYYYAEKYQMADFKAKLLETLPKLKGPSSVDDLTKSLEFATEKDFTDLMAAIDCIKLGLDAGNGLEFFNVSFEYKMEGLVNQVVNHMKKQEVEKSWPVNLIVRIATRNREDFNGLRDKVKTLKSGHWYCRHNNGGYYTYGPGCHEHNCKWDFQPYI